MDDRVLISLKALALAYREAREPTVRVAIADLERVLKWAGKHRARDRGSVIKGRSQAVMRIKRLIPDSPGGKRSGMALCCAMRLREAMKAIEALPPEVWP